MRVVKMIITYFIFNKFFYFEFHVVYEVVWKYMLEWTATDNNMARAHRLLNK
jgi:hypothetical protein